MMHLPGPIRPTLAALALAGLCATGCDSQKSATPQAPATEAVAPVENAAPSAATATATATTATTTAALHYVTLNVTGMT